MDSRGLMKVTHMLTLQGLGSDRPEVTHPLASLDSQVRHCTYKLLTNSPPS